MDQVKFVEDQNFTWFILEYLDPYEIFHRKFSYEIFHLRKTKCNLKISGFIFHKSFQEAT